jgi:hypothetical protein
VLSLLKLCGEVVYGCGQVASFASSEVKEEECANWRNKKWQMPKGVQQEPPWHAERGFNKKCANWCVPFAMAVEPTCLVVKVSDTLVLCMGRS